MYGVGSTTDEIFTFWDLLPTAAELAGATMPPRIDGISAVPVMLGKIDSAAPPAPRTLYYEFCWNNVMNTPESIAKVKNLKGVSSPPVACHRWVGYLVDRLLVITGAAGCLWRWMDAGGQAGRLEGLPYESGERGHVALR